jgi:hypothetical protein
MRPTVCIALFVPETEKQILYSPAYKELQKHWSYSNTKKDLFQKNRIRYTQKTLNTVSLYGPVRVSQVKREREKDSLTDFLPFPLKIF